jgi:hypothetical protein
MKSYEENLEEFKKGRPAFFTVEQVNKIFPRYKKEIFHWYKKEIPVWYLYVVAIIWFLFLVYISGY